MWRCSPTCAPRETCAPRASSSTADTRGSIGSSRPCLTMPTLYAPDGVACDECAPNRFGHATRVSAPTGCHCVTPDRDPDADRRYRMSLVGTRDEPRACAVASAFVDSVLAVDARIIDAIAHINALNGGAVWDDTRSIRERWSPMAKTGPVRTSRTCATGD